MLDFVCCGTSLTGLYYWQPKVVSLLQDQGLQAVAYNLGASGQCVSEGLTGLAQAIQLRPKAVCLEWSMNDCAELTLSAASADTIVTIDAWKTVVEPSRIFLMTMNPSTSPARTTLPTFYQLYRDLAVSEGVGLIDIAAVWATEYQAGDIPDGIHPTFAAQEQVTAPAIASALLASL